GFLDSFNPSFDYDIPLKTGRIVPGKGWVASDYIGIDQGPILAMIANYRNGFVWSVMKKNPYIRDGLKKAGFEGGWLDSDAAQAPQAAQAAPVAPADPDAAAARALGSAESRANQAAQPEPTRPQQPE